MKISKKEAVEKKKKYHLKRARKRSTLGIISPILATRRTVSNAISIKELAKLGKLSASEVRKTVKGMIKVGMHVKKTGNYPCKYYWQIPLEDGKKKKLKKWDIKPTKLDRDMGTLNAIFSRKGTRRSAVDLDEIMKLSGLSEREAIRALKGLLDVGMKLAVTKQVKYYWPPEERDKGKR